MLHTTSFPSVVTIEYIYTWDFLFLFSFFYYFANEAQTQGISIKFSHFISMSIKDVQRVSFSFPNALFRLQRQHSLHLFKWISVKLTLQGLIQQVSDVKKSLCVGWNILLLVTGDISIIFLSTSFSVFFFVSKFLISTNWYFSSHL